MRFFNRRWATGVYGPLKCAQIEQDYKRNLEDFRDEAVKDLVEKLSLHDALINCVEMKGQYINVDFIAGSADQGFQSVVIQYFGGELLAPRLPRFQKILNDRQTRVLYDEFDRDRVGKVHTLLLWPKNYGELSIRFDHIAFTQTPAPTYAFQNYGAVLRGEAAGAVTALASG